jgi:hypothetical protein
LQGIKQISAAGKCRCRPASLAAAD